MQANIEENLNIIVCVACGLSAPHKGLKEWFKEEYIEMLKKFRIF